MRNALNWFEIPVDDLDRAVRFYERTLGVALRRESFTGRPMAIFPYDAAAEAKGAVGGALVATSGRNPSEEGALVYLDASGKLDAVLARVETEGGRVVLPRTDIGKPGFIAVVRDSEGNLVGLHSPS